MIGGSPRSEEPEPVPHPTPAGHTAYLHDGQLSLPDGTTVDVDLDNRDVTQLGVLDRRPDRGGHRAAGHPGVLLRRRPGEPATAVALNVITMSADDTLAAWVDKNCRVVVLESGVTEPTTFEWGIPMPGEASAASTPSTGRTARTTAARCWAVTSPPPRPS